MESFIVRGNWRQKEVRYDAVKMDLSCMGLQNIPQQLLRCTQLQVLYIYGNNISRLENLPQGLQVLYIWDNKISKLENLPEGLQELSISGNNISKLENLSEGLRMLYISWNKISKLENLPEGLQKLYISWNKISKLENLPEGLQGLSIRGNNISKLENLPEALQVLYIDYNNISKLENLPDGLQELNICNNKISKLENLPEGLQELYINKIKSKLDFLRGLFVRSNQQELLNEKELPRYLKRISKDIHSELIEDIKLIGDINSGRWAARNREVDRRRIMLDILCCCPSVAHLAAVPAEAPVKVSSKTMV